jgi:hypothetical protein
MQARGARLPEHREGKPAEQAGAVNPRWKLLPN